MTAIWWIRRDLRVHDNPALVAAAAAGAVVPVFILDAAILEAPAVQPAERRRAFLFAGLSALDAELRSRGSRLVVRRGPPAAALAALCEETGASSVFAAEDASPLAIRRDTEVGRAVPLTLLPGTAIRPLGSVLKADRTPYAVFAPYRRAWLALPAPSASELLPAPRSLPPVPESIASDAPLPPAQAPEAFPPGEAEALARLAVFTRGGDAPIQRYAEERDRPALDGTARLSPYLRFGMLSPRLAAARAFDAGADGGDSGPAVWLDELVWREFYLDLLRHRPEVRLGAGAPIASVDWLNEPEAIAAWREGQTGVPFVDAGMRQLAATGWMHNRVRMVAASFLVKNLLCDWRAGEQWFMEQLVDGDPAANNGGWRWVAGVGPDSAPFFRIMNPVRQGERFDPDGEYVRRWVPELHGLPARVVHQPWRAGAAPGRYPSPIVDLRESRDRALAVYRRSRP